MHESVNFNEKVAAAVAGDLQALESMLAAIQHDIYRVAMRMLGNPADAQDATQEILLKVTTALSTFRGDSQFSTWVHRIAVNHILGELRHKAPATVSFDEMAVGLDRGLAFAAAAHAEPSAEDSQLAFEVFVSCTQRLVQGLDSDDRIAYVLGDLCDLPGDDAAQILQITPAAFRQRLSRARRELASFFDQHCGVANKANACRCAKQVQAARAVGYINEVNLNYVNHPLEVAQSRLTLEEISDTVEELSAIVRTARLLLSQGDFAAPQGLVAKIRELLASGRYRILQ
jgi:RNA polymerase sigma factor (sigma-70 family)